MFRVFFHIGTPKESIFLTTIHGLYFSHHYTHYKLYFSSCGQLFMYCINISLSDLWVLLHGSCTSVSMFAQNTEHTP